MVQLRVWNFGDPITSTRVNTGQRELHIPGVYSGYDVTVVDPQTIELSSGFLLLPDGVLLNEDSVLQLAFPTMPVTPENFTIVATHTDSQVLGGAAAVFELRNGFIELGSLTDGVVIAWIFHPGGGVGLESFFIVQAPKQDDPTSVIDNRPLTWTTPFESATKIIPVTGHLSVTQIQSTLAPLQTGAGWSQTQIEADGATSNPNETVVFVFTQPLIVKPSQVDLIFRLDTGCSLAVAAFDTAGTSVVVTPPPPFPVGQWLKRSWTIPRGDGLFPPNPNGVWTPAFAWRLEVSFIQPKLTQCQFLQTTVLFDPTIS